MKVEFVGLGVTHGYVHNETTNLKKLAKQIKDETDVSTDIRGDNLIVAGNVIPVGGAVVIKGGSASTLSIDAFESQYREVVDFDTEELNKTIGKLEKRLGAVEEFKKSSEVEAIANAKTPKATGKVKAEPVTESEPVTEGSEK